VSNKHVFTLAAVVFLSVALGWLFAPQVFYGLFGVPVTDPLLYMGRRYCAYVFGAAVTMWGARSIVNDEAQRVVLAGGLVTLGLTGLASLYGVLGGHVGAFGWFAGSSELGVAALFAWSLFARRGTAAAPAVKTASRS
jgi:hypothetical protein